MQELKDELATKFVVGLGRVGEIFVVYRREIGGNENSVKAAKCGRARRLWI